MARQMSNRELLAAATEQCRLLSIAERDEVDDRLTSKWHASAPNYRFQILVGGRRVDEDGNVVEVRDDSASFFGPSGLVEAWALIEVIRARAATLGATVEVSIEARAEMKVTRSWLKWEVKE